MMQYDMEHVKNASGWSTKPD